MAVKVLLADDHILVRQGMRALLESRGEISVIAEASDGLETIQLAEKIKPDVTILDIMMPGLNGLEVTRQISKITKILIVSMHANEAYVLEALWNGAYGYVLKDSTADELIEAVMAVAMGRKYLSSPLSERAIDVYTKKTEATSFDPYDSLTNREREVLQLMAEGLGNQEISARLSISPRTVEIHKSNVLHKLNLNSQTEIVRYALKRGILPMED